MIKTNSKVSPAVIRRLPRYYRFLNDLQARGINRISSGVLSDLSGYTASQIRQDLNTFGGFGQQGYGYNINTLKEGIGDILGLDRKYTVVIIGAGNLGRALARHGWFPKETFKVVSMFDSSKDLIGKDVAGIPIRDVTGLPGFLSEHNVDIGLITTDQKVAQDIADILVEGGVHGIWNFTPTDIETPSTVVAKSEHLSDSLHELLFYVNHTD